MTPHEHLRPTSYYLQKDGWHRIQETPYEGHVGHLDKHILKYAKRRILGAIVDQTYQLSKWLKNNNIDEALLNESGITPQSRINKIIIPYQIFNMTMYGPCPKTILLW